MRLEHSPSRQRKRGSPSPFAYELLTRDELAARLHINATTVTRSYRKWGLRPVRVAGRVLFPSNLVGHISPIQTRRDTGVHRQPQAFRCV